MTSPSSCPPLTPRALSTIIALALRVVAGCCEYYGRALKVQEVWQAKACALNMPLSAKGHTVGQRGLGIDSHKGRFHMLPELLPP